MTHEFNGESSTQKVSLNYFHKDLASAELVATIGSSPNVTASVVAAYEALKFGFSGKLVQKENKPSLSEYSLKFLYTPSKSFVTGVFYNVKDAKESKDRKVGVQFFHNNESNSVQTSADVFVDAGELKGTPDFRVALSHQCDKNTTVKTRYQSKEGTIAVSLKQKLSETTTATIAAEKSLVGLDDVSSTNFGATLNLKL